VTVEPGTGVKSRAHGLPKSPGKQEPRSSWILRLDGIRRASHIASFVGYAVGVEPKIVIFTSLDEPKGFLLSHLKPQRLSSKKFSIKWPIVFNMPVREDIQQKMLASGDQVQTHTSERDQDTHRTVSTRKGRSHSMAGNECYRHDDLENSRSSRPHRPRSDGSSFRAITSS